MLFSRSDYRKYIKFSALLTAFIFCPNFEAQGAAFLKKKISPPHSVSSSFLPNGMQFNHKIKNENGDEFSIENLEGNVVIIVFFTTWCPSCPTVLENMDYLTEKFREEGIDNVKIIPLNLGNESVDYLKIYYKGSDLQLLNVYHSLPPGAMSAIRGVPCCLIFDKSGTPACGYLGAENYRSGEFIEYIKKLAQQ